MPKIPTAKQQIDPNLMSSLAKVRIRRSCSATDSTFSRISFRSMSKTMNSIRCYSKRVELDRISKQICDFSDRCRTCPVDQTFHLREKSSKKFCEFFHFVHRKFVKTLVLFVCKIFDRSEPLLRCSSVDPVFTHRFASIQRNPFLL